MTRIKGHAIVSEAIPRFVSKTCNASNRGCTEYAAQLATGAFLFSERVESYIHEEWGYNDGHARCTCGAESPHLTSQGKRRQWHRDHKAEIAAGQAVNQ